MHKEEMLLDGQTEPITSMPTRKVEEKSEGYDPNDPLDAPSH